MKGNFSLRFTRYMKETLLIGMTSKVFSLYGNNFPTRGGTVKTKFFYLLSEKN